MAFFEDLGKKISQAGQTAVQKTKDITEIAKINGMISDEEKKVAEVYRQIGKLFVSKHRDDSEPELAGLVKSVLEAEAKISQYKQQVCDIKGVVRCEKCGAEIQNSSAFCSTCGTPVPKKETTAPQSADVIKCAGCGATLNKDMRFCTTCGRPVEATPAPAAEPEVAPTTVAEPVAVTEPVTEPIAEPVAESAPVADTAFCKTCGKALEPGFAFCTNCGARVDAPVANKCKNCGAELNDGMAFCTNCGTKVD